MKTITIAGAAMALLLGLTACGSTTGNTNPTAPASASATSAPPPAKDPGTVATTEAPAPAETTEVAPAAVETPEPLPTEDGPSAFGQVFEYTDGMTISVAKPVAAFASDTSAGGEETAGQIRIFTVTITNGTKKVFDPSLVQVDVNYGPDGTAAERVFDSAQNLGSGFEGKILPGKKQVAKVAFGVPHAPQEVLVSIAPSWDHNEALFLGKL